MKNNSEYKYMLDQPGATLHESVGEMIACAETPPQVGDVYYIHKFRMMRGTDVVTDSAIADLMDSVYNCDNDMPESFYESQEDISMEALDLLQKTIARWFDKHTNIKAYMTEVEAARRKLHLAAADFDLD